MHLIYGEKLGVEIAPITRQLPVSFKYREMAHCKYIVIFLQTNLAHRGVQLRLENTVHMSLSYTSL